MGGRKKGDDGAREKERGRGGRRRSFPFMVGEGGWEGGREATAGQKPNAERKQGGERGRGRLFKERGKTKREVERATQSDNKQDQATAWLLKRECREAKKERKRGIDKGKEG